jgi:hypothetical protein
MYICLCEPKLKKEQDENNVSSHELAQYGAFSCAARCLSSTKSKKALSFPKSTCARAGG